MTQSIGSRTTRQLTEVSQQHELKVGDYVAFRIQVQYLDKFLDEIYGAFANFFTGDKRTQENIEKAVVYKYVDKARSEGLDPTYVSAKQIAPTWYEVEVQGRKLKLGTPFIAFAIAVVAIAIIIAVISILAWVIKVTPETLAQVSEDIGNATKNVAEGFNALGKGLGAATAATAPVIAGIGAAGFVLFAVLFMSGRRKGSDTNLKR